MGKISARQSKTVKRRTTSFLPWFELLLLLLLRNSISFYFTLFAWPFVKGHDRRTVHLRICSKRFSVFCARKMEENTAALNIIRNIKVQSR